MRILVKNGFIVNPDTELLKNGSIIINGDRIEDITFEATAEGDFDRIIDADGRYVMPGFIDLHVHLREPGYEYKETVKTGTQAAAAGGYTTICPMPNTNPVIDTKERVEEFLEIVKRDAVVNVLPVGAVTLGQKGTCVSDIYGMKQAGICAISEDGRSVMDTGLYREAMLEALKNNIPVFAHCEDIGLVNGGVMNKGKRSEELLLPGISNAVEDVITARDIILAKETGVRLHLCHCSTKDSVELVKLSRTIGASVTAEVCPHHFSMTDEDIPSDDANYKMNPPLRSREDVEALKEGMRAGIMQIISTDHAPHGSEEKSGSMKKAPFGIVGLETALPLSYTNLVKTGYLSLSGMVRAMTTAPAGVLSIDKGSLAKGKIADITIADFDHEYVIDAEGFKSKGRNTPFNGKKVFGRVIMTIVGGKVVYEL